MEKYMAMTKRYDDDQRQYQCMSKYDTIVNKFGELINMVDMVTKAPKRRRESSSNSRGKMVCRNAGRSSKSMGGEAKNRSCKSGINGGTPSSTGGLANHIGGGALVQLITNHLLELNNNPQ